MAPPTLDARRAELDTVLPPGGVVLAVTDEGGETRHAPVRALAARLASRSAGRVVLFHAPTGPSDQTAPRLFVPPSALGPDCPGRPHTGSRVRDLFLVEASEIRAAGAEVAVWLGRSGGPGAITEAIAATGAGLVLMPAAASRRCAASLRIDRTLAYYAARIHVPLVSVDQGGRTEIIAPLGRGLVAGARQFLRTRPAVGQAAGIAAGVRR